MMKILRNTAAPAAWVGRRPWRLAILLPLLMALDSPGCVMSERPLARFDRDSVDDALLGEWINPEDEQGELALWVGLRDERTMEFRSYESPSTYIVLTGYTTVLEGQRYANLQFIDSACTDCDERERARIDARFEQLYGDVLATDSSNVCTWLIVRYSVERDGRLRFSLMDSEPVASEIIDGRLDGELAADSSGNGEDLVCLTESSRRLRRLVTENGARLFALEDEGVLVRR